MRMSFSIKGMLLLVAGIMILGCGKAVFSQPNSKEIVQSTKLPLHNSVVLPTSEQSLIINTLPEKYTYENFIDDMCELERNYGDAIKCVNLCDTVDGRKVYDIILGEPNGDNHILVFAAMHAREYITTQVVMRQLCDALDVLNGFDTGSYHGKSKKTLLENVTVHFVPIDNPDGVSISQFGLSGVNSDELRSRVAGMMGDDDYEQWKANAVGVDINRNFDADWQEFVGAPYPSAERYKGAFPGSEHEAAALIELTKRYHIRRAISYHTCGALIYWYYKQTGGVLNESRDFAELLTEETGYPLDDDYTAVDAAGYKDWAVYQMGVPSVTIEVGAENGHSIINPVPIERFGDIWDRNKNVIYVAAYSLQPPMQ